MADRPPPADPPGFVLERRAVPPALRGLVRTIAAYATGGPLPGTTTEAAALVVPLIFVFDGGFDMAMPGDLPARHGSFLAGLTACPVTIRTPQRTECLQVDFTPLGALRFFGPALADCADRMVGQDDYGDRALANLADRLASVPDWTARLDLAAAAVAARLAAAPDPAPQLARAWRLIEASGGQARIERLAGHVGWSRRTLSERFRTATGMTPKTAARIARFTRAGHLARTAARPDWAGIAAACGYADQAHLSRDWADLAGLSPQRWRTA